MLYSHSCYLLCYLAPYLSADEIKKITEMLKGEKSPGEESPSSASPIEAEKIQSPIPLDNIPSVRSVSLIELVDLLKPIKIKGFVSSKETLVDQNIEQSPFIFSPFEAKRRRGKHRPEILWVAGNPGEIKLIVENTLPLDLRVSKMVQTLIVFPDS